MQDAAAREVEKFSNVPKLNMIDREAQTDPTQATTFTQSEAIKESKETQIGGPCEARSTQTESHIEERKIQQLINYKMKKREESHHLKEIVTQEDLQTKVPSLDLQADNLLDAGAAAVDGEEVVTEDKDEKVLKSEVHENMLRILAQVPERPPSDFNYDTSSEKLTEKRGDDTGLDDESIAV